MADLNIAGICFNKYGAKVAERLNGTINEWGKERDEQIRLTWVVRNAINPARELFYSLNIKTKDWTEERFKDTDIIIYICPAVQAVKHIFSSITEQMSDPAVIVIDEKGEYCVPLLSGRRGEANDIGQMLQDKLSIKYVNPLIDDTKSRFNVEEYAVNTNMVISNIDYAKEIAAALESGHEIGFYTNYPVLGTIPDRLAWSSEAPLGIYVSPSYHTAYFEHTLWLIPKCLSVGIICSEEHSYKTVRKAIIGALQSLSLYPEAISKIATVKECEKLLALQTFAVERDIPIVAYDEKELEGIISSDDKKLDKAEAAALKSSEGKLIINTITQDDISVAIAMENIYIKF